MDWVTLFIIILSSLIFLFFLGVPVAYSFLFVNILFAYIFLGKDRADATNFKHLSIDQFFFLAPCSPLSPHGGDHVSLRDYPEYDEDFGKVDGESAREAEPVSGCRGGYLCHALRFLHGRLCHARTDPFTRNGEEGISISNHPGSDYGLWDPCRHDSTQCPGCITCLSRSNFCWRFSSFHYLLGSFNGCFVCSLYYRSMYSTTGARATA